MDDGDGLIEVEVELDEGLLAEVDRVRGDVSLEQFVREAVEAKMAERGRRDG